MCDTFITIKPNNAGFILAKNSDREPEEGQSVAILPRLTHTLSIVQCTYIAIPQVKVTNAVMLSKPFQMWGAEMGVNEHGLVIGNEAVFTKVKFGRKNDGLTGMDMLRLALERCDNALGAVELITSMLKAYGQDACGGYKNKKFYYHNSFIIADKSNVWILETAGREWAARKVHSFDSISNGLTIATDYELISENAVSTAKQIGAYKEVNGKFSFSGTYSDWLYTRFSKCKIRQSITHASAEKLADELTIQKAIAILQQHNLPASKFHPKHANASSICMHTTGLLNPSSTTGSMIADISQEQKIVWLSTTAYPCLSVYFPFAVGQSISQAAAALLDADPANDKSIWHEHMKLYNMVRKSYKRLAPIMMQALKNYQHEIFEDFKNTKDWKMDMTEELLHQYKSTLVQLQQELVTHNDHK